MEDFISSHMHVEAGRGQSLLNRKMIFRILGILSGCSAVRLAHLLWEQGVPGSNPGTPT